MDDKTFPDSQAYPLYTPVNFYSRGFDVISQHWHKTESWSDKEPGSSEYEEYVFWRMNIVIWVCCAIESIANLEGVSWMGEEYYKDTVERLNITQKIKLIHALKYNRPLPPDENTLKRVKELSEVRNQCVHPKTHSVENDAKHENKTSPAKLFEYDPHTLRSLVQSVSKLIQDPREQ